MNTTTAPETSSQTTVTDPEPSVTAPQQLYRPVEGRMLAGVAAGVARYFDVDANIIRIVFAVLTVMGGAGVPLYLAGWVLIPEEGADQSIASSFLASLPSRSR
jgi:phage shock protein PspC (stress-responsive transcriptional regulator)